jgi:hypothetical protein
LELSSDELKLVSSGSDVGESEESLQHYQAVYARDDRDPYVAYKHAEILLRLNRTEEGTRMLERAVEIVRVYLGLCHSRSNTSGPNTTGAAAAGAVHENAAPGGGTFVAGKRTAKRAVLPGDGGR